MKVSPVRRWLTLGVSTAALFAAAPALAQTAPAPKPAQAAPAKPAAQETNQLEEIVVTAERRESSLQDTPIAVSAFSADTLKAQRLDGGENLVLAVPNVNYSRSNFGGFNLQIRGIGTQLTTNSGEPGVSFNINELPVGVNHFADTDFYDVERVEVLRGPQGTLYGRTATGGAVNVITAKPTDTFRGSLTSEFGNFDSKKVTGFLNVPVNDFFQFRVAGFFTDRDGYGTNTFNGDSVDGRNLNSFRFTGAFKFNDRLKATVYFDDFNEKDNRNRVGKQLCTKDPGPTSIGGAPTTATTQGFFSQGCQFASPYTDQAYGTPNTQGTTAGIFSAFTGLQIGDANATHPLQDHNLHDIESAIDPIYEAKERLAIMQVDWDVTDNLHLSSITGYNRETNYNIEDYNRIVTTTPFGAAPDPANAIAPAIAAGFGIPVSLAQVIYAGGIPAISGGYPALFPGGVVNDPQIGPRNRLAVFDISNGASDEKTEELRLSSSFKGPLNFSAGGIIINSQTLTNYFVFFNPLTALAQAFNGLQPGTFTIDPNSIANSTGHNYYDSRYGTLLTSYAGFGELYYKPTDDIRVTAGFRFTVDNKKGTFYPTLLFVPDAATPGKTTQHIQFEEPSARFNVEWTPHLSFTNHSLVYGTYSHGYKSGGFNTPTQDSSFNPIVPEPFLPEIVDSFEVGTKNTLLHNTLTLNLTGFYYMYQGYQISTIRNKAAFNSNIDAEIYGLELETVWQPVHNLTLNANLGYLHTKIKDYSEYDPANPTNGDSRFTVVKDQSGENCIVNTAALATLLNTISTQTPAQQVNAIVGNPVTGYQGVCGETAANRGVGLYDYLGANVSRESTTSGYTFTRGLIRDLSGNDLPNSPDLTISLGAQYVVELPAEWRGTVRGDFYWQDDSYARTFNTAFDKLKSYENINATLAFDNAKLGVNVQFFVKNLTDSQPFTGLYTTAQDSALFLNTFTLDPRTYGVSLTKRF